MNATDIINLVNAGFTKDDILKMFGGEPEQKEVESDSNQEVEPDSKQVENTTNTYPHLENDNAQIYAELIKKLDNLADTIKTSNFRTPMPFNPIDTETKADNFFANIISPKLNEEGSISNG